MLLTHAQMQTLSRSYPSQDVELLNLGRDPLSAGPVKGATLAVRTATGEDQWAILDSAGNLGTANPPVATTQDGDSDDGDEQQ